MASITLNSVTKRYRDGTLAVRGVDLEIADGEFMILVGPSGCGKTTLLRMIAGLEAITDGEILVDGDVVNDLTPRKRDMAMVFQNYALYPHMTVAKNMGFALRRQGVDAEEIQRKVRETAELLGISDQLERKPANLSGGQRQRVAMGRAIVRDPTAFLMDEPLSNLDAKLRIQTRAEILRIQRRLRTTTVYVTHDQTEAMTLGDRLAVMRDGVLQQVGTPDDAGDLLEGLFGGDRIRRQRLAEHLGRRDDRIAVLVDVDLDRRLGQHRFHQVDSQQRPATTVQPDHSLLPHGPKPHVGNLHLLGHEDPQRGRIARLERMDVRIAIDECRRFRGCIPGNRNLVSNSGDRAFPHQQTAADVANGAASERRADS